jgi:hypothetical protein
VAREKVRPSMSTLRSVRSRVGRLLRGPSPPELRPVITVRIDRCRHYCAFRYGSGSFNPYENYAVGLVEGTSRAELHRSFEEFLMYYRPRDFGEVFGITLSRRVPLWIYPWRKDPVFDPDNGWVENIDDVPDIITHFCSQGIKRSKIDEEYFWLERAYAAVSSRGYRPEAETYVEAHEFTKKGESVYLLTDGNHRVSSMAALGHEEVAVRVTATVRWDGGNHRDWPQVLVGTYSEEDALNVFNVYFAGVDGIMRSEHPASIIEDR